MILHWYLKHSMNSLVEVKNISKTFGSGHTAVKAVDNVSFSVKDGEIALIMGPSGSGKTTLLTIIGTLLSPDSGSVFINGLEVTALSKRKLPDVRLKKIGFIFQSFNLLSSLNVLENVAIVLELMGTRSRKAKQQAQKLLEELGLGNRLKYNVANLSGGEKQRVSIARALVTNPAVVLADEPTANLDSKSGHKVMELLRNIAKQEGKGVIIVTHDMRLKDIADKTFWIEDGKLREHSPLQ